MNSLAIELYFELIESGYSSIDAIRLASSRYDLTAENLKVQLIENGVSLPLKARFVSGNEFTFAPRTWLLWRKVGLGTVAGIAIVGGLNNQTNDQPNEALAEVREAGPDFNKMMRVVAEGSPKCISKISELRDLLLQMNQEIAASTAYEREVLDLLPNDVNAATVYGQSISEKTLETTERYIYPVDQAAYNIRHASCREIARAFDSLSKAEGHNGIDGSKAEQCRDFARDMANGAESILNGPYQKGFDVYAMSEAIEGLNSCKELS